MCKEGGHVRSLSFLIIIVYKSHQRKSTIHYGTCCNKGQNITIPTDKNLLAIPIPTDVECIPVLAPILKPLD